ncbi:hypothetical protein SDC9_157590 [bioreactor metagenome]|uniref:Uncharacterized protein n=1 Tax=bioreactor metagenome TaxID=1076179 RepID=A0A645F7E7_9ZZZZ
MHIISSSGVSTLPMKAGSFDTLAVLDLLEVLAPVDILDALGALDPLDISVIFDALNALGVLGAFSTQASFILFKL